MDAAEQPNNPVRPDASNKETGWMHCTLRLPHVPALATSHAGATHDSDSVPDLVLRELQAEILPIHERSLLHACAGDKANQATRRMRASLLA